MSKNKKTPWVVQSDLWHPKRSVYHSKRSRVAQCHDNQHVFSRVQPVNFLDFLSGKQPRKQVDIKPSSVIGVSTLSLNNVDAHNTTAHNIRCCLKCSYMETDNEGNENGTT